MYVFVVITCGTGKRPCCSIATTTIKGASYEPLWDECYWLSLIGPKTPDIYPQDTLTFSVFSSSGHTEDTFLGQASIEVTREMFLGMAFTYTLDLHHAYQPIYLDENTTADHTVSIFAFLGLSMPDFWFAILLIIVFAANLQWLPAIGYAPLSSGLWEWLKHLILPSIAIGTGFSAIIARMLRSSLLGELKSDYMRTAAAKGLSDTSMIVAHALPNAMLPVITVLGIAIALLFSGAVVVENVFSIKGLGRVLIQGILNRDYPVVQGAVLLISAFFVFANLIVDLLYAVIDPRVRYD